MQIQQLELKDHLFPCFRCMGMAATHRVNMDINNHGKLIVCLCESCMQLPETELYAHFMQIKEEKTDDQRN